MPAPIPRAAPVTMATFPLRDMIRCFKIEVVWNELEDLQGRKMDRFREFNDLCRDLSFSNVVLGLCIP